MVCSTDTHSQMENSLYKFLLMVSSPIDNYLQMSCYIHIFLLASSPIDTHPWKWQILFIYSY